MLTKRTTSTVARATRVNLVLACSRRQVGKAELFSLSSKTRKRKKNAWCLLWISRPDAYEDGTVNSLTLLQQEGCVFFFLKSSHRDFLKTKPEGGKICPRMAKRGERRNSYIFSTQAMPLKTMD